MNNQRPKLIIGVIVAVIVVLGLVAYAVMSAKHSSSKTVTTSASPSQSSSSTSTPTPAAGSSALYNIPSAALNVASAYIQAQQDSVGVDQTSPTSWLSSVQSITTPSWFAELQPQASSTGNVSADYTTAHTNNYTVTASLSDCIWDQQYPKSATSGVLYCQLTDQTLNATTNQAVTGSSLPFGWTRSGQQLPVMVQVVQSNGNWLVANTPAGP